MNATKIRKELRTGNSPELERKRKIILLSAIGLLDFTAISLYQTGIIRKLPDLPWSIFNTNKVNASKKAYALGLPDGTLSATLFALNMALATAGGSSRTGRKPIFDALLSGAILANAGGAVDYLFNMVAKQKKVCLYCLAGAGISFASLKIIAPDAIRAFKRLTNS